MASHFQMLTGIALVLWGAPAPAIDSSSNAQRILRQAGLTEANQFWVCRDEARILRQIDQFNTLRIEFLRTRRAWRDLGDQQDRLRAQLSAADKKIRQLDQEILLAGADIYRKQVLEERLRALRQRMAFQRQDLYKRLDGLNERSELSQAAKKHAAARARLEAYRIALRAAAERSGSWYNAIDEVVVQAVATLDADGKQRVRLGPVHNYQEVLPKQIQRVESLLADTRIPIYRAEGHFRIPAVLNESAPVSLILADESPLSMASISLLESAGVPIAPDTPERMIRFAGRRLEGHVIKVPWIRIGGYGLGPIDFLALEPGFDGTGPLLNTAQLDRYQLEWNYERLELEVRER